MLKLDGWVEVHGVETWEDACASHRYRPRGERPLSRALCVVFRGDLYVVDSVGPDLDCEIDCVGELQIQGDGWVNLEDGLHIWEGLVVAVEYYTSSGTEYDTEYRGEFRRLRPDEWEIYKESNGETAWDLRAWLVSDCTNEEWMEAVHG